MNIKQTVSEITTRPMNRKEFLASAGAAALAVVGVTAVLKSLGVTSGGRSVGGYGASAYGGKKDGR